MALTIVESPFRGDLERNKRYLHRCILDSISRREIPFASHAFYTQFLDDDNPGDRFLETVLGYNFWEYADRVAFYTDYGMTTGMLESHARCVDIHKRYEMRSIGKNDAQDPH